LAQIDGTSSATTNALTNYQMPTAEFDSISGTVNFTGLGSGTDFNAIVDQLVAIESIHKQRLETWKATWEAKITSMKALNQRLDAVEEAAGDLDTESEFMVRQASTSDPTVLTGTASNSANPGAYQVEIGSDIKHILRTAGVASNTTDVVSGDGGTLGLYFGSSYATVGIGAADDLDTIAAAINAKLGSTVAEVESDGTDSRPYHLVLTATSGGAAGRISVVQNPTDLSFDLKDVALDDDAGWGSVSLDLAGQFTGDQATASVYEYAFTANTGGTTVSVGADAFTLGYDVFDATTGATISSGNTISVAADYQAGEALSVERGWALRLGSGDIADGESFTIRGFANDVDAAELGTWTGSTVTTSGNYLGSVNKTYSFTVVTEGDIDAAGSQDTAVLRWTDSTGGTGTVSVSQSGTAYEVEQGVYVSFGAGSLNQSEDFQVNVFAPDQQQGQDKGLAQATKVVHDGWSDESASAVTNADATFSYTYGGQSVTLNVEGGTTLSQLAADINDDSDNPGVSASILNDGQGLPTSYKLVLTGSDTGAQYQISNVEHTFDTSFSTGGGLGGGFIRTQWAANSMIKVDGYPAESDQWLQRDTNQVQGVVEGVTLNLHDAGEAVITVSNNTGAIYGKIEALINSVNYAQSYIRQETKYDPDGEETGLLIGNYSYYILKSRIDTSLNTSVSGLVDGEDTYTHLSQIGIHTDPDAEGAWVINGATLMDALNTDAEAVANLFIENTTKGSTGVAARVKEEMKDLTDPSTGTLNVLISNYNDIIANIDKKIESEEDRIELYRERQTLRFARLEATLAELNAQASQLESAIAQLPNTGGGKD
jgi:flagellar hook-associated protein 2